ncbi:MAG: class I adenylate-forming enzyme family protein [Vicinamibacterales bacterium]
MLLHQFVEEWAARTPQAPALIEPARWTTYAELDRSANRFGHLFHRNGVAAGDRVVIALDNGVDMVAAYLGALKAGAVAVPLPGGARSDRLQHAIDDCTPRLCVVDAGAARAMGRTDALPVRSAGTSAAADASADRRSPGEGWSAPASAPVPAMFVASPAHATGPEGLHRALLDCPTEPLPPGGIETDLAAIIYTSGSTGVPRGVMLSHRNFVSNARSIVSYLRLTAKDRVMCVLPFHYVYGLSLLHTHLAVGGSLAIENRAAFANVVLEGMREHEVTGFAGVPSTFALLLHRSNLEEVPLPHLRYVTQAGGGMSPAQIAQWLERGPKADFYVMYGATEAAARLTYLPPADLLRKLGSVGRAIPGVEVVVMSESGEEAKPGETGELVARGENISAGYWNNPEETAERFGPEGYRTGDLGYADEEGYLYLVGRRHDMIKIGAHRVGAKEIEDVLHEHPAVIEAAVVAAQHPLLGEAPVAFVALREPVAESALRAFCAARLAVYKVPARVIGQKELPKLPGAGKVDRGVLRALAGEMRVEAVS